MNFHYQQYFKPVFERVNLALDTDWRLGLIGRNGCGKTTFLKLLEGALELDKGIIIKDVSIEYFPYECTTKYVLTLDVLKEIIGNFKSIEDTMERLLYKPTTENLLYYGKVHERYQEAGGYEIIGRIQKELYLMGLSEELLEREYCVLSGGEKTKILMIALFLRYNTFVLLDEPTNHLDIDGKKSIINYLNKKKGFMVASHDRQFLDEITDHILAINKSDITLERGNYTSWKENVERREAFEFRTKINLEKEISHLEKSAVVRRSWAAIAEKEKNPFKSHHRGNSSRAAKFMRQAKNAELEVQRDIMQKRELLKNYEAVSEICFFPQEKPEIKETILLQLNGFTFGYDDNFLFQDFSFQISEGERIWVKGSNGCGKTTLLKIISGHLETNQQLSKEVNIAVVYQEPLWQDGYVKEKIVNGDQWERFLKLCDYLDITKEMLERPLQTYSNGERGRVDVARALSEENSILLLDEPLNYMDICFREQLEKAILASKPTIVFVEHDEWFGSHVATRIVELDCL